MGRVVRFNYSGPKDGIIEHDDWVLQNSLVPHLEENKVT